MSAAYEIAHRLLVTLEEVAHQARTSSGRWVSDEWLVGVLEIDRVMARARRELDLLGGARAHRSAKGGKG